jgi:hypothetical protein
MPMDEQSYNKAEDEVSDLQNQMNPERSECVRPLIMDHVHRYLRADGMTKKFHELEGLVTFCTPYIEDRKLRESIEAAMESEDLNMPDFIRNYKSENRSGVSWSIVLEGEYARLHPKLRRIWFKVQKALVRQDLIPWSLTYPEKMLESELMNELLSDLQGSPGAELRVAEASKQIRSGEPPPWDIEEFKNSMAEASDMLNEEPEVVEEPQIVPPIESNASEEAEEVEEVEEPDTREESPGETYEEIDAGEKEEEKFLEGSIVVPETEVDLENYVATDAELDAAAEIWKKKLREKKNAKTSI